VAFDLVTLGLACADVMVRPVDEFPERGKLNLVPQLEVHLGGLAGVTAAVYCRLMGEEGSGAAFVGRVGADGFGDYVHHALASNGVNVERVSRTPDAATAATVVLVSSDGERTFIHHTGAAATLAEEDIDFDFVARAKWLHWGGPAVTPGLDGEPIGRVFDRARQLGLGTSIDTCYDGHGIWYARIEHALPHTDVVMSSLEEAREYTGQREPEDIADWYRARGAEVALVKLGDQGLYVKDADQAHHVPAHRVTAVDTTGAGDATCAGFLYGYLCGWDLLRTARLANAVGGLTVQAMGGAEGVESLEKTIEFMESGI